MGIAFLLCCGLSIWLIREELKQKQILERMTNESNKQ